MPLHFFQVYCSYFEWISQCLTTLSRILVIFWVKQSMAHRIFKETGYVWSGSVLYTSFTRILVIFWMNQYLPRFSRIQVMFHIDQLIHTSSRILVKFWRDSTTAYFKDTDQILKGQYLSIFQGYWSSFERRVLQHIFKNTDQTLRGQYLSTFQGYWSNFEG